jgi:hypothetical protein
MHAFMLGKVIDFGRTIFQEMVYFRERASATANLVFPAMVTHFCLQHKVPKRAGEKMTEGVPGPITEASKAKSHALSTKHSKPDFHSGVKAPKSKKPRERQEQWMEIIVQRQALILEELKRVHTRQDKADRKIQKCLSIARFTAKYMGELAGKTFVESSDEESEEDKDEESEKEDDALNESETGSAGSDSESGDESDKEEERVSFARNLPEHRTKASHDALELKNRERGKGKKKVMTPVLSETGEVRDDAPTGPTVRHATDPPSTHASESTAGTDVIYLSDSAEGGSIGADAGLERALVVYVPPPPEQ